MDSYYTPRARVEPTLFFIENLANRSEVNFPGRFAKFVNLQLEPFLAIEVTKFHLSETSFSALVLKSAKIRSRTSL